MRKHVIEVCKVAVLGLTTLMLIAGCTLPVAPTPVEESEMVEEITPTKAIATPSSERIRAVERPETGHRAGPLPFNSPIDLAKYDLAQRLGVVVEDVEVLSVKEMEMPAADLGCPGAPKAEAAPTGTVKGQEITFAVGDKEYVYRAHGWRVLPCRPQEVFETMPMLPHRGMTGIPIERAREDLAQRLGVSVEEIEVQAVEAVEWPDASLGCPQPGMMYAQVITPGYRILLQVGGKTYEYHSDRKRVILCQPKG